MKLVALVAMVASQSTRLTYLSVRSIISSSPQSIGHFKYAAISLRATSSEGTLYPRLCPIGSFFRAARALGHSFSILPAIVFVSVGPNR